MAEESKGMGQQAKSLIDQAKKSVGAGGPPLATEAGGRIEGMQEAFRAFGEGDVDRFLEAFSEEVEWSSPKGDRFPGSGNHQGRDAVRETFVEDAKRSFSSFGFRPDRFLESPAEDFVVAIGAFKGEAVKGDGQLDVPAVQVWEYDGDQVVFVGIYTDSGAFPGVVTEQEEKEQEEERRKEDEGDDDEKGEKGEKGEKDEGGEKSGSRDEGESPARQGEDEDDEGDDDTDDSETKETERTS